MLPGEAVREKNWGLYLDFSGTITILDDLVV